MNEHEHRYAILKNTIKELEYDFDKIVIIAHKENSCYHGCNTLELIGIIETHSFNLKAKTRPL